jgi:hypothetical protein
MDDDGVQRGGGVDEQNDITVDFVYLAFQE